MAHYDLFILVKAEWVHAKGGNMSKSAAHGLLNQFAMQYQTRLFRGLNVGRFIAEKGPVTADLLAQADALEKNAARRGYSGVEDRMEAAALRQQARDFDTSRKVED
jgi:hypothetical protein